MSQYKITITNLKPSGQEELIELHEYDNALFFSKSMYENTITGMFFYAAQSIDYKHMNAVVERDGATVLHLIMDTYVDGSTIYTALRIARPREKYQHVRTMTVAD